MLQVLQTIQNYDYVLIDTRGAYGVLVENAVLATDICLSPLPPETLAAHLLAMLNSAPRWKIWRRCPGRSRFLEWND